MLAARCTQRDRIIEQDVRSRIADVDVIFTIRDCPALRAAVPVSQRMAGAAGVDRHLDLPLLARVEPYLLEADETLRRLVEGCGQTDVDLRNFGAVPLAGVLDEERYEQRTSSVRNLRRHHEPRDREGGV